MSYLFRDNPGYFEFLESVEREEVAFRQMARDYAYKSALNNRDYRNKVAYVNSTLRSVKKKEIQKADSQNLSKTAKRKAAKSFTLPKGKVKRQEGLSYLNSSPAHIMSTEWPVRPTSAQRILSPTKLKRYQEMNESEYVVPKDPPIIHNTGITISKPENQKSRTIRTPSYQFSRY